MDVTPHPRIMQRRLDVALSGAQSECLKQIDALHESLGVLRRTGYAEAEGFQGALLVHRTVIAGLDAGQPTAAAAIMQEVVALCGTMEQAMTGLQAFLAKQA